MGRPFWSVPHPRNAFFAGRDDVIAEIRKRLTRRRKAALIEAVSGLGGIGKTQTAVEYAYRYRKKYQALLWLDAESSLALKTGCGELAQRMHLPHPENDLDQAVLALKQWLATQPSWLLIFDNADDPDALKPFLPDAEHGHILVTSRAQDFQDLGIINPVQLEQWPVADATAFLLKRCNREDADAEERSAAEQLARALDGLPLALEQAAAFIAAGHGLTFRRYLDSYRSQGLKQLEARRPALGRYPRSVVSTWAANFDAVQEESPAAADVLRLSAFLAPDAIPFELLARGASELGPEVGAALGQVDDAPLVVDHLLQRLGRFSLIRIDGHAKTYSIHRLVQEVLKAAMGDPTCRVWAERAVRAVSRAFPAPEYVNWPLCGRLLSHALAVVPWIEPDRMPSAEAGLLLGRVGSYLDGQAQYAEAEPLLRRALEIHEKALGPDHPDTATSMNQLAALLQSEGKLLEAERWARRALEIREKSPHPDPLTMAQGLNNLGYILLLQGWEKLPEAVSFLRRALTTAEGSLGAGHIETALSLNNLAKLYTAMGRYAEAEPLYIRAVELLRETDQDRLFYANLLNNLAELYRVMDRNAEAEPLFKEALAILRTALGERHPAYATTLNNLAELYRSM